MTPDRNHKFQTRLTEKKIGAETSQEKGGLPYWVCPYLMIWADWHLGQFIDRAVKREGSGLHFTSTMHDYQVSYVYGFI